MLEAVGAEWRKLWGARRVTWTVLAALPVLLVVIYAAVQTYQMLNGKPPSPRGGGDPAAWAAGTLTVWALVQNLGWLLAAAWAATAFGGEYRWNTLKLIVPHRGRLQIIAAKYVVVVLGLAASLMVFGLLAILLQLLDGVLDGTGVPAGVDWGALLGRHAAIWAQSLLAMSLVAAYAALASVILRSTAGGIVVSVVLFIVLSLPGVLWVQLSAMAYRLSPAYAVPNLGAWATAGRAQPVPLPAGGGLLADGWLTSLGVAGVWLIGLAALAALIFRRQDFN